MPSTNPMLALASASNAIIIGFNVRPDATAKATAEREGVDMRLYRVIYNAIEDVEAAMKGMLDPIFEEKVIGHAEVRQLFKASGVGTIAGSYVLDGTFQRGCSVRITREGTQIFEGPLASLKRFKDDVKEVRAGYECGLVFEKFNDVQEAGSGRSIYYGRSTKIGIAGFENMRKHSIKNTRINGEVQRELSNIIRGGDQRSENPSDDLSRGGGSCTGSEDLQSIDQRAGR